MEDKAMIRVRMSDHDAHYAGGLVDGARILNLFGDVATELLIRNDGDEGLFVSYDSVEFLKPVHAGDFIEAYGMIVRVGNTSRLIEFTAQKVIGLAGGNNQPSAADVLEQPIVVVKAMGTCVVPKERQRKSK